MTIELSDNGEVMISMYNDYVKKLINKLPKSMIGNKPTASPENLFKTNDINTNPTKVGQISLLTN